MGKLVRRARDAKIKEMDEATTLPVMPDEETLRQQRRRAFQRRRRTGRASTILTNPDRLG